MSHEPVASAAFAPSPQPEAGRTVVEPLPAPLRGAATVPGDKSISHRAVLFAAMAEGTSRVSGVLDSEDVRSSIKAVSQLGARVSLERQPDGSLAGGITGWGASGPRKPDAPIDCGNSGTTARLLMGVLAPWDRTRGDHGRRVAPAPPHAPHHRAAHEDGRALRARRPRDAAHNRGGHARPARYHL